MFSQSCSDRKEFKMLGIFIESMLLGVMMGVFYECFRFVRQLLEKPPSWFVFIQDLLYFVCYGFCVFLFSMEKGGEIRLFYIAGAFAGTFAYLFSLGILISKLLKWVAKLLRSTIGILVRPVTVFLSSIAQLFRRIFSKIHDFIKISMKFFKKTLIKPSKVLYNNINNQNVSENVTVKGSEEKYAIKGRVRSKAGKA